MTTACTLSAEKHYGPEDFLISRASIASDVRALACMADENRKKEYQIPVLAGCHFTTLELLAAMSTISLAGGTLEKYRKSASQFVTLIPS